MRGHCTDLENVKQEIEMFNINTGMYRGVGMKRTMEILSTMDTESYMQVSVRGEIKEEKV